MNTDNNDNLEQKIIDTAREIFIEKGFTDTSMSEIAAKVGMNGREYTIISEPRTECFRPYSETSSYLLSPK